MLLCLWSVKGGSGCTVTAAAVGLLAAEESDTLLVDLGGDLALALGASSAEIPSPGVAGLGWGIAGWLAAPDPPADALARLERPITPRLSLLPLGEPGPPAPPIPEPPGSTGPDAGPPGAAQGAAPNGSAAPVATATAGRSRPEERLVLLARLLARDRRTVVVDLGQGLAPGPEPGSGQEPAWSGSTLDPFLGVATSSLLVVRACYLSLHRAARRRRPDGIVLVDEPGRAMRPADVVDALGVPVVAFVPWEAAVSRAVDAGILAHRVPRALQSLWSVIPVAAEVGR